MPHWCPMCGRSSDNANFPPKPSSAVRTFHDRFKFRSYSARTYTIQYHKVPETAQQTSSVKTTVHTPSILATRKIFSSSTWTSTQSDFYRNNATEQTPQISCSDLIPDLAVLIPRGGSAICRRHRRSIPNYNSVLIQEILSR
jgi:hypothetical protein